MSNELDYADESFREAWRCEAGDANAIRALIRGGAALVNVARKLELMGKQIGELQKELATLREQALTMPTDERALRDVRINATAECGRCEGRAVVYDPYEFGWEELNRLGDDACEQATSDRGYGREGKDTEDRYLPPEEGACPDCDGRGRVDITLGVEALLIAMAGDESATHRLPADALAPSVTRLGVEPTPLGLPEALATPRKILALPTPKIAGLALSDTRGLLQEALQTVQQEISRDYDRHRLELQPARLEAGWECGSVASERIHQLRVERQRVVEVLRLVEYEQRASDQSQPGLEARRGLEL